MQGEITKTIADIEYQNIFFDFGEAIAKKKAELSMVPEAADIDITVADEKGATGVMLVPSRNPEDVNDFYLNAYVAGNKLIISGKEGKQIDSAESVIEGELRVDPNTVEYVPQPLTAQDPVDEIITITMMDGAIYKIHTVPEQLLKMEITGSGVAPENAGIYTFRMLGWMVRVNSDGYIVYYRDINCAGLDDNFQPHETPDGMFYSYCIALTDRFFGLGEGMFVIMDENYRDIDTVTLMPNDDPNHTHGEGYLDFHEIRVISKGNYLVKGYNRMRATMPDSLDGVDGTHDTYGWVVVMQQQKDGKLLWELTTADYPLFFEASVEPTSYVETSMEKPSDYIHMNSLDWIADEDGNVIKLLTSMRNLSALVQFDVRTGAIDWIFGGKASTLTGFDEFCTERQDHFGNTFNAVMFGQHYARYEHLLPGHVLGNIYQVSVFDNGTGAAFMEGNGPAFTTATNPPTLSRTFRFLIDEATNTAKVFDVIDGTHLTALMPEKYFQADHCCSVDYYNENSVCIGWGLDMIVDSTSKANPKLDPNYPHLPLYAGVHPVMCDYDMANDKLTFVLSVFESAIEPKFGLKNLHFSYRTYKTPTA